MGIATVRQENGSWSNPFFVYPGEGIVGLMLVHMIFVTGLKLSIIRRYGTLIEAINMFGE
jgi:hypothetical protein